MIIHLSRRFPNERIICFTAGTVDALEFYGAVPKILKPDNAKTASIKNTKDELILNATYEQLQYYYGVTIVPAPPLCPRAKPTVENGVRLIEEKLLSVLKGRSFSSFDQLNEFISEKMKIFNSTGFEKIKGNRKENFERFDKPRMNPLPKESFSFYEYKVTTVPSNYHVEFADHFYSVPYQYYKRTVIIKASYSEIKITDSANHLLCTHKRAYKAYPRYITDSDHMPPNHQYIYKQNTYDGNAYKRWARTAYGEEMYVFICRMISSFDYEEQAYRSCNAALHMAKKHPKEIVKRAAQECINIHACRYSYFKRALNRLDGSTSEGSITHKKIPDHENIRGKENFS